LTKPPDQADITTLGDRRSRISTSSQTRPKARRGELFLTVAVGYVKVRHDRIALDPDQRVRAALKLAFDRFAEFQSIRQVHLWLRQEGVLMPAVETGPDGRRIVWKPPIYKTIHNLMTNPIYGGAYAFGRTASRVTVEQGRKRVSRGHRRDREDWDVLIVDHHEGYVSWAEFERNQRLIADNANSLGLMARGAVRRGDALLAGLLHCSHCGRRLHVYYSGKDGFCVRYGCRGAAINHGTGPCISFGGLRVDAGVAAETLRLLSPLGIAAALEAVERRDEDAAALRRQAELALTQVRYEADLARRQYDAVDPANRLVAAELERRWNDRLAAARCLEDSLAERIESSAATLSPTERGDLLALGADLPRAWDHPGVTAEERKRILRAVIEEIVVTLAEGRIDLVIHWKGGDHTRLCMPRNRTGQHRWSSDAETGDMIRALARQQPDGGIAATLNRLGRRTGRDNPWTEARVRSFRSTHGVPVHRTGEMAERGEGRSPARRTISRSRPGADRPVQLATTRWVIAARSDWTSSRSIARIARSAAARSYMSIRIAVPGNAPRRKTPATSTDGPQGSLAGAMQEYRVSMPAFSAILRKTA
jgi:hypothetical protein